MASGNCFAAQPLQLMLLLLVLLPLGMPTAADKELKYVELLKESKELEPYLIAIRRKLHMNPAIAYEEYYAQELVIDELTKLGLSTEKKAITGVVAQIGADPSSDPPPVTVLLRADMDALPIQEEAGVEYKSQVDGVMHACGHGTASTASTPAVSRPPKLCIECPPPRKTGDEKQRHLLPRG